MSAPTWVEVKPATPCKGCSLEVCHTHGRFHIPFCWACVHAGHSQCTCDVVLLREAKVNADRKGDR